MFLEKNMNLLLRKYPLLYSQLLEISDTDNKQYKMLQTKTNTYTCVCKVDNRELYLHSKYDPIKEVKQFVKNNIEKNYSNYILYGFGLGYVIQQLMEQSPEAQIFVFETNLELFKQACAYIDLSSIIESERVKLIIESDLQGFAYQFQYYINKPDTKLLIHLPSVEIISEAFVELKYILEEFRIKERCTGQGELFTNNFNENIKNYDASVDTLFNKFNNVPLVLVSSGPSLNKNIHLLREIKGKAVIIAVGRSLKPLLEIGVEPDFVAMLDPNEIIYDQIKDIETQIPFIVSSNCYEKVMQNHKGLKLIALKAGDPLAEEYASKYHYKTVQSGGSVATMALDAAIQFGCNPIIFVGQDLAYTGGKNYVKGTAFYQEDIDVQQLRKVQGNTEEVVYTTKGLSIFKRWIENRIRGIQHTVFINATEGGAKIEGTVSISLQKVIEKYCIENIEARIINEIKGVLIHGKSARSKTL